jgi:hypothetical protein
VYSSYGCSKETFIEGVQRASEPGCHGAYREKESNVILSAGGFVLFPTALFSHSTGLEDLFAYTLAVGHLRHKDIYYPSLVDEDIPIPDHSILSFDDVPSPEPHRPGFFRGLRIHRRPGDLPIIGLSGNDRL